MPLTGSNVYTLRFDKRNRVNLYYSLEPDIFTLEQVVLVFKGVALPDSGLDDLVQRGNLFIFRDLK